MSSLEIAMKSKHCSGCHRTVDLTHLGGKSARCPVCGRGYEVDVPETSERRVPPVRRPALRAA
jgi:hypothetical protein